MTADYLTDRSHLLVAGVTGARTDYGGKTALANWLCDEHGRAAFDVAIFGNFKGDGGPARTADRDVATLEAVGEAVGEGVDYISFTPASSDWETESERLGAFVDALPKDMSKLVVLDESPELDDETLEWFVRVSGNGANCKAVVLSQAPGDLPMTVRRQCILVWVGPVTESNKHVFTANNRGNHFDAMRREHEPYHWSVLLGPDDGDRDHYEPVPEEYA